MAIRVRTAATFQGGLVHHAQHSLRQRLAAMIDQRRQRRMRERMLRIAIAIDHPGVLADVQTACGPFRR